MEGKPVVNAQQRALEKEIAELVEDAKAQLLPLVHKTVLAGLGDSPIDQARMLSDSVCESAWNLYATTLKMRKKYFLLRGLPIDNKEEIV